MRLNKFLAQKLNIGRRTADEMIARGDVIINGQRPEMGHQVEPTDTIRVRGKNIDPTITEATTQVYVYNKPVDCVCTTAPEPGQRSIYDLLPPAVRHFKCVGRLDRNTGGLLLLTNSGDLVQKLSHPSNNSMKWYQVESPREITDAQVQTLSQGVVLDEGLALAKVKRVSPNTILIGITTGWNRQIRNMMERVDVPIKRLIRTAFGPIRIETLALGTGSGKFLSSEKVHELERWKA